MSNPATFFAFFTVLLKFRNPGPGIHLYTVAEGKSAKGDRHQQPPTKSATMYSSEIQSLEHLSGRNSKSETEVAITREALKTYRQSVRLLIVEVRSPGDQQHFVAIPPCAGHECRESQVPNARY
jgi:hypothetical protein